MAAVNDCFTIGSTVLGTTCFNEEVEGEVLAFDHSSKMLILKCRSKTSDKLNDVHVLNLSLCSNVQVVKECNGNIVEDPQKLSLEQLKRRLRKTVLHRQTYLKSKNADVSQEGQELYRVIAKQYSDEAVTWQGSNIQVFNDITIEPPYRVENVTSSSNNHHFCSYIKKMIARTSTEESVATSTTGSSSSVASVAAGAGNNSASQSASSSASSLSSASAVGVSSSSSSNKMASGSPVVSAN